MKVSNDEHTYNIGKGKIMFVREGCWWCHTLLPEETQDWQYFDTAAINNLSGKIITARGWLYSYRNRLRMRLRHPNNLFWQQ